jgi:putative phage-type endonuclease
VAKNVEKHQKSDGTTTVKVAKGAKVVTSTGKVATAGQILTNLPNEEALAAMKADAEKIVSKLNLDEVVEAETDDRSAKEIRSDLRQATKASDFVGEVLDVGLDAVIVLDNKIAELEDERLSVRLNADALNRPLLEEEIKRAEEMTEQMNDLRRRKRELMVHTKDVRITKAEADVAKYEEELALEAAQGKKLILDYEGTDVLGEAVETGTFEANSPEWHEARSKVIGGSDVGVIMGNSPFTTANRLLATKLGLIDPSFKSTAASLGDTYEPIIQHEFAKRHAAGNADGSPVFTVYHTKASWRHKDNPTHGANFDGLYDSTGKGGAPDSILEIKAVSKDWKGEVPQHYVEQVLWYMHITGLRKGTVACLTNQTDYKEYEIIPKEGEIENLVARVKEFEARLETEKKKIAKMNKRAV